MKSPKNKTNGELKPKQKQTAIAKESKTVIKKTKEKKTVAKKAAVKATAKKVVNEVPKELAAKDIAKIEKKKAKKQAQKLKKQQNKLAGSEGLPKEQSKKSVEPGKNGKIKTAAVELKPQTRGAAGNQKSKLNKKAEDKDAADVKRERDPAAEAATVFVGNLPINTKRVQLVRLFQPFGTVQSIRLRTAGGKKLFKHKQRKVAGTLNAYVVLETVEIATKALTLNGCEFKGNHLRITKATKSHDISKSQETNEAETKCTVFVGNLKYSANEEKLREIFSSCGEIEYIRCLQNGDKGCNGVAYVCFKKADAVGLALELNETLLDDRPINVERYSVKKLGAKQARDAAAATAGTTKSKTKQNSASAKKRLDKKQRKENGKTDEVKTAPTKKKSEYRGVKVDGIKKPKKKSNNQMTALAKKIAPKAKD